MDQLLPEVLQIGAPELQQKCSPVVFPVSAETFETVEKLTALLAPSHLIGISAPQIGITQQIFITNVREPGKNDATLRVFINPVIRAQSEVGRDMYEGCGSVLKNGLFGPVWRPDVVTIEAYDLEGKRFSLKADGLLARVIQHEYDHLEGILFTEKVSDYRKLMSLDAYKKFAQTSLEQKEAYKITILEFSYLP